MFTDPLAYWPNDWGTFITTIPLGSGGPKKHLNIFQSCHSGVFHVIIKLTKIQNIDLLPTFLIGRLRHVQEKLTL